MTVPTSRLSKTSGSITNLVPYAHVADVEASIAFYALFGFATLNTHALADGHIVWALIASGDARLMLAQSSGPIDAAQQAVLLSMYSEDISRLRSRLIASGLHDAGKSMTSPGADKGRRAAFEITYPFYMPAGELRVHDPDGYVLLIGQLL
jgi:hypothetical protein